MDVNATWRRMLAAGAGEAQELALAVLGWLKRGGFPPQGYTIGEAQRVAQGFANRR